MEVLKSPIEISLDIVNALDTQKGVLGFNKKYAWFVVIQDYKIDKKPVVSRKWGFLGHKETTDMSYFLTEFKIHIWNIKRQTWTHLSEEGLHAILYDEDFPKMRQNYFLMIKAPLEFLGVKFKEKPLNE